MTKTTTSLTSKAAPERASFNIRGLLISIVLNAVFPFMLYTLTKRYISSSELVALSVAAVFPIVTSIFDVVRSHRLDFIAILALLGILTSVIGVLLGGDPKILLIRESFLTGALGLACFISLLMPRPLMFYVGRQFMAGNNPVKIAEYNAQWQLPRARQVHRLITTVWGVAYVGEFILRVVLVYTLSAGVVLIVSPFMTGGATVLAIVWTFSYVRRVTSRAYAAQAQ